MSIEVTGLWALQSIQCVSVQNLSLNLPNRDNFRAKGKRAQFSHLHTVLGENLPNNSFASGKC